MESFLETQKELAKEKLWQSPHLAFMKQGLFESQIKDTDKDIDILITQVLANHAKELVRKVAEKAYRQWDCYNDCEGEVEVVKLEDFRDIINSSGISIE